MIHSKKYYTLFVCIILLNHITISALDKTLIKAVCYIGVAGSLALVITGAIVCGRTFDSKNPELSGDDAKVPCYKSPLHRNFFCIQSIRHVIATGCMTTGTGLFAASVLGLASQNS